MELLKTKIGLPSLWPVIIVVSSISAGLLFFAPPGSLLRAVVAFWFLLVCPGMAFVRLLALDNALARWTLAIALSLTLDALVAITILYLGIWSPALGLLILITISLTGASLQVWPIHDWEVLILKAISRIRTELLPAIADSQVMAVMNSAIVAAEPAAADRSTRSGSTLRRLPSMLGRLTRITLWRAVIISLSVLPLLFLLLFNGGRWIYQSATERWKRLLSDVL